MDLTVIFLTSFINLTHAPYYKINQVCRFHPSLKSFPHTLTLIGIIHLFK
ncbi:hypothetical protein MC7420_1422 [Coleofasciculus chthonoplastes PCC 7420]|uniref:Uncharacterized protein n=1 Tax=Coleofasciculus chthonoplastes PCC 7420 TaxID=118168 RepID=B4VR52_9CYAN|nr:hypothetical protein MC7420_1422 [Coleofasciculus chthonoplastes PCC 7420]